MLKTFPHEYIPATFGIVLKNYVGGDKSHHENGNKVFTNGCMGSLLIP